MEDPEKVRAQKRRWYQRHKEQIKARSMERYYRVKDQPQFKKKMAENLKRWRKKNWKRFLANANEYQKNARKKNPERFRDKGRRKYGRVKVDPERYRRHLETSRRIQQTPNGKHIKSRYRARRKKATGSHSAEQWMARVVFYGWRCAYCKTPLTIKTLTKDHIIPLSKRGTDWASNLAPACQSCNARKKNRPRSQQRP
jgi:5-methylcytosine-specific restriction endonuclease McrA